MALGIKSASFGIDAKGVDSYVKKIKSDMLEVAAKEIKKNADDFKNQVAKVWVGKGADDFVNAFKGDANAIAKKLTKLYDNLETTFDNVIKQYNKMDQAQDTTRVVK